MNCILAKDKSFDLNETEFHKNAIFCLVPTYWKRTWQELCKVNTSSHAIYVAGLTDTKFPTNTRACNSLLYLLCFPSSSLNQISCFILYFIAFSLPYITYGGFYGRTVALSIFLSLIPRQAAFLSPKLPAFSYIHSYTDLKSSFTKLIRTEPSAGDLICNTTELQDSIPRSIKAGNQTLPRASSIQSASSNPVPSRTGWCSGNVLYLYSGSAPFESRPQIS